MIPTTMFTRPDRALARDSVALSPRAVDSLNGVRFERAFAERGHAYQPPENVVPLATDNRDRFRVELGGDVFDQVFVASPIDFVAPTEETSIRVQPAFRVRWTP